MYPILNQRRTAERYSASAAFPAWGDRFRLSVCACLAGIIVTFAGSGCVAPTKAVRIQSEVDSLRIANRNLGALNAQLSDSLATIDFIQSGQYDRELRLARNRVNALNYNLAVCVGGGSTLTSLLVDDAFEPASALLTKKGMAELDSTALALIAAGDVEVVVEGHADSSQPGAALAKTYPTNWELSAGRATAVVRYLIQSRAVPAERIRAVSFGDGRPSFDNSTTQGRKLNRRIRIATMSTEPLESSGQ